MGNPTPSFDSLVGFYSFVSFFSLSEDRHLGLGLLLEVFFFLFEEFPGGDGTFLQLVLCLDDLRQVLGAPAVHFETEHALEARVSEQVHIIVRCLLSDPLSSTLSVDKVLTVCLILGRFKRESVHLVR